MAGAGEGRGNSVSVRGCTASLYAVNAKKYLRRATLRSINIPAETSKKCFEAGTNRSGFRLPVLLQMSPCGGEVKGATRPNSRPATSIDVPLRGEVKEANLTERDRQPPTVFRRFLQKSIAQTAAKRKCFFLKRKITALERCEPPCRRRKGAPVFRGSHLGGAGALFPSFPPLLFPPPLFLNSLYFHSEIA